MGDEPTKQERILRLVQAELDRAAKFPIFNSAHEGYGVLLEEVDELWDAIKNNKTVHPIDQMAEAIQVAAMAVKYVESLAGAATLDALEGA